MNTIWKGKVHAFLWIFVCLSLLCLTTPNVFAQTVSPIVGKWGYTMIGHTGPWYTWKTEAGTVTFYANGTATTTYKESANTCPNTNYCKISDTQYHTYVVNADGTVTLDGVMKLVVSDDGKVVIGDGTSMSGEIIFFVAVKMDPAKPYTSADATGQYYTGAYEYDSQGMPYPNGLGKYRLWSITSDANNGNFLLNGTLNGDGSILQITGQTQPYNIMADGTMQIGTVQTGFSTGYVGDGKVAIFSNARGGVSTDSSTFIALKKQDRSYTQADLQGAWIISTFEDYAGNAGTVFGSKFGMLTCDPTGNCSASLKEKNSDGTTATATHPLPQMTVSTDGSINNFYLTNSKPHFAGAIGNDGKTMLLIADPSDATMNDRLLGVAVKCSTCSSPSGATISFTGKVEDSNKTAVTDAVITAIDSNGNQLSISAPTYDSSGNFTLTGLPSGANFWFKISKSGYRYTYSGNYNSTSHIDQIGAFTLFTDSEFGSLYSAAKVQLVANKGVIWGRVYADTSPKIGYVNGVQLVATGTVKTYPIAYLDAQGAARTGATSTDTSGRFAVFNVDDGDTVTVTGTKTNWTGLQRIYKTFANSVSDGRVIGTTTSTISYSSNVQNGTLNPSVNLTGVKVQLYGNSTLNIGNDASANFTLAGLPPDTTFQLMFTKSGFVPTYSSLMNFSSPYTYPRYYSLYGKQQIAGWGVDVSSGKGAIAGRVIDNANPQTGYLSGAVATYTSNKYGTSAPYTVTYQDDSGVFGGSSTYGNGKFFILNVEEGDFVTVDVALSNYTFPTKKFATHAISVCTSSFLGTSSGGGGSTISFTGEVVGSDGSPLSGATIEMAGDSTKTTTSGTDGSFTLTGLPSGANFHLKVSKAGTPLFVPVYSRVFNSTTTIPGLRPFKLFTNDFLTTHQWPNSLPMINGAVVDSNNPSTNLSDATITVSSSLGHTYTVTYENALSQFCTPPACTSTSSNGYYYIFGVAPDDTVTVQATRTNTTFQHQTITFVTHSNGMNEGSFFGTLPVLSAINLSAGWNFISFPKVPSTDTTANTTAEVLKDVSSSVRVVWGYDNVNKAWLKWIPSTLCPLSSALCSVESGKGYWIYMNAAGMIDMASWAAPTTTTITLYPGWNLVGYNGTSAAIPDPALNSISGKWKIIWNWANGVWYAQSADGVAVAATLTGVEQKKAYWIKTNLTADQTANWE
ncbi:MAG: carboxypeptidase-like regulatory domain-containing protein [Deltaproteobacteria bacterium]